MAKTAINHVNIEEQNPLADNANVFTDLLNSALSEIDWQEIAENYLSE